jgi:hypothetical protein
MMMEFSQKTKQWISLAIKISALTIGVMVLVVSIARAGWETKTSNDGDEVKGNNVVEFIAVFGDGTTTAGEYKLPETGILPDNWFYGVKRIRNSLWLLFAKGTEKIKMALLLADKSTAECGKLVEKNEITRAVKAGNEAINNLEYADRLISQIQITDDQIKQLHYQIFWAGYTYREVFGRTKDVSLINRIDDWNKTQEKNRQSWDN